MSNKLKRVQTSSHQIDDDHSKNITNDNTNDSDKTNYAEVKSSQDKECSKSCEQIKVEQEVSLKTLTAILENNKLRYCISHEETKITNFFMLFTRFLLIVSSLSLLNGNIFVILLNKKAILFSMLVVASLILLVSLLYVRIRQSMNNVLTSLENDCNLFEKAVQLSIDVNTINKNYMSKQCLRSRYSKFLASEYAVECFKQVILFTLIAKKCFFWDS